MIASTGAVGTSAEVPEDGTASAGIEVRLSNPARAPELVHSARGPLSAAAPGLTSVAIVRRFLADHNDIYRLTPADLDSLVVLGDSPGGGSGLRQLRLEQRVEGLPVFGSETRFLIDRAGRVWRSIGTLLPALAEKAQTLDRARLITAQVALQHLLLIDAAPIKSADITAREIEPGRYELRAPAPVAGTGQAQLVLFPRTNERLVAAWLLTVFTTGEQDWQALVDAESGALLWRRGLREHVSVHPARFSVYVAADGRTPAESPAPQSPSAALPGAGTQFPEIARSNVDMLTVQDLAASPNGWINDCPGGADGCDTTRGNNVDACLDRDASPNVCDATLDAGGRPRGNPDAALRNRDFLGAGVRDFVYTPAPSLGNPDSGDAPLNTDYQRGAATQVFYVANWYHDRLFALGFDEASGNFQQTNFQGSGGVGGDRVAADVQNPGPTGSSTPADGAPLRIQLGIVGAPSPDRDTDLDAQEVVHELTHGLTHRLVGNTLGLLWDPARSMGEGWSDFYALALLNTTNADQPNGNYPMGAWIRYQDGGQTDNYVYGVRRFPYTTDNSVNPLTWADIDPVVADDAGGIAPNPLNFSRFGAMEAHNAGTLWALSLWEIRARIIADPNAANGDVPGGNETTLQLVTDALKMTPNNASFIDGREALLAADCATNACANEHWIWAGFADRGLGYHAIAPLSVLGRFAISHMGVGTSFEVPHLDVGAPSLDVLVNDAPQGNGNGRLDPGETATLTIRLSNPWRGAPSIATGIAASLSSTTTEVSIADATATYPSIGPLGNAQNVGDPVQITVSNSATCGQSIEFDLQTQSSLGVRSARFALRVGTPGGAGAALVYSATPNLAIPDNVIDGVSSDLTIADDFEIADLNFRIDSLVHAVNGQLSVMLRAPSGYGGDMIWKRGGLLVPNQGVAANFTNVVIDDDLPISAAEDLNQSTAAQAPFSGDWLPAFNSPFWDSYATVPAVARDTVGQLARLDGSSTKGTWSINVADGNNTTTGTLETWSLIVQPRLFSCTPYFDDRIFADGFEP